MVKRSLILSIVLIALFLPLSGNCTTLSAVTSRSQISMDESVTLTLSADGDIDDDPDLTPLKNDFEVVGRRQSSNMSYINGSLSRSKVWSIELLPRHSGHITIAPICSGKICTQATSIVVTPQPMQTKTDAPVLLEATVSAPTVIAQAQIIYTIRIFMRQPLLQASLSEITPQGVETNVHKLGDDIHYETQRGGWRYQVIERNYALFPQHSGQLTLPPMRLEGVISDRNAVRRNSSFASPFDLIDQQGQRLRLRSKEIKIRVTPPTNHPAQQPWLPAQKLTISDSWQNNPPTFTVGEPATRSITTVVAGLAAATLPELKLTAPASCKTYPDQSVRKDTLSSSGITGTMIQKIALVPTTAGTFTLPALSMRWWNLVDNKWCTTTVPALNIHVLPAQRRANPSVTPPANITPPPATPTHVTPASNPPHATNNNPSAQPTTPQIPSTSAKTLPPHNKWLWISIFCGCGWLVTIIVFRHKYQTKRSTTPAHPASGPTITNAAKQTDHSWTSAKTSASKTRVISCAQANHAAETRHALTAWIDTLDDGRGKLNWDDFLLQVDEPLRLELLSLDQHLYTPASTETWEGAGLARALEHWQSPTLNPNTAADKKLPSFYPRC